MTLGIFRIAAIESFTHNLLLNTHRGRICYFK